MAVGRAVPVPDPIALATNTTPIVPDDAPTLLQTVSPTEVMVYSLPTTNSPAATDAGLVTVLTSVSTPVTNSTTTASIAGGK